MMEKLNTAIGILGIIWGITANIVFTITFWTLLIALIVLALSLWLLASDFFMRREMESEKLKSLPPTDTDIFIKATFGDNTFERDTELLEFEQEKQDSLKEISDKYLLRQKVIFSLDLAAILILIYLVFQPYA